MRAIFKINAHKKIPILFKRVLILSFLVFLAISVSLGYTDHLQDTIKLKQWDNPIKYTAKGKSGLLFWCGNNDELGLRSRKDRYNQTLGFFKNNLETLTTEDTIRIGDNETIYDQHFFCSADGRYFYFIKTTDVAENKRVKRVKNLCYYDRYSKSTNTVLSYGAGSGIYDADMVISPQGKYFIAPMGYSKLTLPGIDNAKVISIDVLLADLPDKWPDNIFDKGTKYDLAWDYLDRRIYLLDKDEQTIFLIDPKTLQREKVKVQIDQYEVSKVRPTGNLNKLFLIANHSFDLNSNIYLLDLANKKKPVKLFLANIRDIGISAAGIYAYKKIFGVERVADGVSIEKDASKRYAVINLIDDNHNEKNIKKKYFGAGPNDAGVFLGDPLISRDGSRMAFISVDKINNEEKMKIHLLKSK